MKIWNKTQRILKNRRRCGIGSSITIANMWLPSLVARFHDLYPKTPVRVQVDRAKEIVRKVLVNEVDLGFTEGVCEEECLVKLPFSRYRLTLSVARLAGS